LKKKELSRLLKAGDLDKNTIAALAQVAKERRSANLGASRTAAAQDGKDAASDEASDEKDKDSTVVKRVCEFPLTLENVFEMSLERCKDVASIFSGLSKEIRANGGLLNTTKSKQTWQEGLAKYVVEHTPAPVVIEHIPAPAPPPQPNKRVQQKFSKLIDSNAKVVAHEKAKREVETIRENSEIHRSTTINKIKQREEKADARVQKRLELRKRAKQMGALKKCVAFAKISATARDHIIDAMMYEKVVHGSVLCMQGDPANCMYLLMSGSCTVMVNMKEVGQLNKLDVFGEAALFASGDSHDPSRFRTATVIAIDDLEVLILQGKELTRLISLGDLDQSTIAALAQVAKERKSANSEFEESNRKKAFLENYSKKMDLKEAKKDGK
jgi:hypothetical protein